MWLLSERLSIIHVVYKVILIVIRRIALNMITFSEQEEMKGKKSKK